MLDCGVAVKASYSEQEIEQMETQTLLLLYKQTGNEELKWPLVLRYEYLVKNVAMQVRGVYSNFAQLDDIVGEGILTLLSAIDKFDPDKGVKFETFVAKRLRGMMIDLARKQDWMPRTVRRRAKEIDTVVTDLVNELGRYPTEEEIANRLGVTRERYSKDMADIAYSNVVSLEGMITMYEESGQQFQIPSRDTQNQPENVLQDRELQTVLAEAISKLRKNEQLVLSLHYEKNLQLKESAQVMDLSAPRISQIHARAIEKLRQYLEEYMGIAPEGAR